MPQCPHCGHVLRLKEGGRCARCGDDLAALEVARSTAGRLYEEALEHAKAGRDLQAVVRSAGAASFSERPEPWVLLGKLFANEGRYDRARECFEEAGRRGAESAPLLETLRAMEVGPVAVTEAVAGTDSATPTPVAPQDTAHRRRPLAVPAAAIAGVALGIALVFGWNAVRSTREGPSVAAPTAVAVEQDAGMAASSPPWAEAKPTASDLEPTRAEQAGETGPAAVTLEAKGEQAVGALQTDATPARLAPAPEPALAAPTGAVPPPAEETSPPADRHVVASGECLWTIARERLGTGASWTELYERNRDALPDPDRIRPGLVLRLP